MKVVICPECGGETPPAKSCRVCGWELPPGLPEKEESRGGDWIITFTGKKFWPMDPRPEEVCLLDIAHALSLVCRFNGHVKEFYSVAQHSVLCARLAFERGMSDEEVLAALLHDASKAYLCDIPRPVKAFLPGYKAAEKVVMEAVAAEVGFNPRLFDRIKEIDTILLATEARDLLANADFSEWSWDPRNFALDRKILPLPPYLAEAEFLREFYVFSAHLREGS